MKVIARHSTPSYDIAIIRNDGSKVYQVIQIATGVSMLNGAYITFDRTTSIVVARQAANLLWTRGMGREVMIACGPLAA